MTEENARRLAAAWGGCTSEQACALSEELPVVMAEEIIGRWKGVCPVQRQSAHVEGDVAAMSGHPAPTGRPGCWY